MRKGLEVSHVVAAICWISIALLPYVWIVTGEFSLQTWAALAFWFVGGFIATANTLNIRRKRGG